MRIFRAPTSSAVALALTFAGKAVALAQTALPAIGYELSSEQGYALLILAAMFRIGAVIALYWHSIKGIRISLAAAMGFLHIARRLCLSYLSHYQFGRWLVRIQNGSW